MKKLVQKWKLLWVIQVVRAFKKCGCLIATVQRNDSYENLYNRHFASQSKKMLKEADSMSIIRAIASYSVTKRWKMNCNGNPRVLTLGVVSYSMPAA